MSIWTIEGDTLLDRYRHGLKCPECYDENTLKHMNDATKEHYGRMVTVDEALVDGSMGTTFYCMHCGLENELRLWMEGSTPTAAAPRIDISVNHFEDDLFEV